MESSKPLVLVTGATGYVGGWTIAKLLQTGKYRVRGTVRNMTDKEKLEPVEKALKSHCSEHYDDFEFAEAELLDYDSIKKAVEGVTYVIHIASPMPGAGAKNVETTIIKPAVEGNLNVLQAWVGTDVGRIIFTSSGLTMWDHKKGDGMYSHDSVVDEDPKLDGYSKSKIRAENVVRDFIKDLEDKNKRTFDVMFINPGGISGVPLVPACKGESIKMFKMILEGKVPRIPVVYYPMADVQDVAQAHVNAIDKGKHLGRYPIWNGTLRMVEIIDMMKEKYEPMGYKISNKELAKCIIWIFSCCNADARNIYYHWGIKAELDGKYAAKELGLDRYTTPEESIIGTCDFLIENKFVKEPKKKK